MGQLYREALSIQNNSPTLIGDQSRWRAMRNSNCSGPNFNQIKSCVLEMTKARVGGLAAVVTANGRQPNSSEPTAAPVPNPWPAYIHLDDATEAYVSGLAAPPGSQQAPATTNAIPPDEIAFVDAVTNAHQSYGRATTDFQKGATKPARAKAICSVLRTTQVSDWVGKVSTLSTNGDGKGVLGIEIGPDIFVQTTNNALSDALAATLNQPPTLIEPESSVFSSMGKLNEGTKVRFSGTFIRSDTDCVQETSMTMQGSMTSPEFLFRFSSVEP
jgi:hypothetical protein